MHARLEYDAKADAWTLVDNDSANGSHVNGLRVLSAVLAPGDRVGFGSSVMKGSYAILVDGSGAVTER